MQYNTRKRNGILVSEHGFSAVCWQGSNRPRPVPQSDFRAGPRTVIAAGRGGVVEAEIDNAVNLCITSLIHGKRRAGCVCSML
jgi:hypothetical protein